MILDLPFLNVTIDIGLVILCVLFYVVGLASVMGYQQLRSNIKRSYRADDTVVEAVVSEYTRRLRDYDRVIAELQTKMKLVESKSEVVAASQPMSQTSQFVQPHAHQVIEPVTVTQRAPVMEGGNGTTDYILKLLAERPCTSREVQHAIGRTREHTARLMKKLHEDGLVSRDMKSKPFRYGITEGGRLRLRGKALTEASFEVQQPV